MLGFEGSEKKLELVTQGFKLRELPWWTEVVEIAGASILSKISTSEVDAYLLSESSLFVFDNRVVMITCGRTHLVKSALFLLSQIPLSAIEALYYERKNEYFPRQQPSHFVDDLRTLESVISGKSYRFGELDDHHLFLFQSTPQKKPQWDPRESTLEILMHGLTGAAREAFNQGNQDKARRAVADLGLGAKLFSGHQIDEYYFTPCGYSLNALCGGHYATLHVTPEEIGSYASLETNDLREEDLGGYIRQVLEIFQPRSFDIVLFSAQMREVLLPPEFVLKNSIRQELDSGLKASYLSYLHPSSYGQRAVEIFGSMSGVVA